MKNVINNPAALRVEREEAGKVKPFGLKDKIGYLCGDLANDFFFIFASSFLTVFYTNVLGINGAIVGTLFLVSRCFDAFTDFGMGRLVDKLPLTKDGRYRVWIKRMMVPVAVSGMLMFIPWVAELPMMWRIVYIYVTYIFWGSFMYTSINIPYGSLASAMTTDPVQRSSLSTARSLGAAFAGVFVGSITPQFIYVTGAAGEQVMVGSRVFVVACIFTLMAIAAYFVCYKWTTERVVVEPKAEHESKSLVQTFKDLVSNRALISLIAAAILSLLGMLLMQTLSMYLYMDYFKSVDAMTVAGLLSTGCTLILAPIAGKIVGKFGKKESCAVSLLCASIIFGIMFVLRIKNPWVYCGFLMVANLFAGLFSLMTWAFVSDVIDYQTVKTGSTDGGTVYGMYSFSRKIGQALAGGLGGFVLAAIGYQTSVAGQVVVQSEFVVNAIYSVCTLAPCIAYFLIAMVLWFWYPLSKKKLAEIAAELEARNGK